MNLQRFLMDQIGPFSVMAVPNAVFSVLMAAFMGWALGRFGARARGLAARSYAIWAALSALALVFVRTQLPLAVALLAVVLAVRGQADEKRDRVVVLGAIVLGLGCGSGASLVALALAVPFILLVRWAHAGREAS